MSARKAEMLAEVHQRAYVYKDAKVESEAFLADLRRHMAEAMVAAKDVGATQQEIADKTDDHEPDRLSRQRVKQLIDDYREGRL